jgi:hypothetical protein
MGYINVNSGTSRKRGNPREHVSYLISLSPVKLNPRVCEGGQKETSCRRQNMTELRGIVDHWLPHHICFYF